MNRKDLILQIMKEAGVTTSQATKALNALIEGIKASLKKGERVTLSGFGSFEVKIRNPRKGRNPKTGEEVAIPRKKRIKFNPSRSLKELL
ncbi:MAG: HU family DNA-binding protein [Candidatus Aminicenantes bacterium]|nr:HU family DNA-binding protein [Candidatus Aminicenantes bacterium]